jgi:hypothetical protein
VSDSFQFHTPATLESPAGHVAADLEQLRTGIASVNVASLFHHVTRIPARFPHARDLPENDFARWVGDAIQLPEVSERLAFAGSVPSGTPEALRGTLMAVLDRVSARDRKREASEGAAFHFVIAQTVLAPLGIVANEPVDVIEAWPWIDLGSAFYHLIEAPAFGQQEHALIPWLREHGAKALADSADQVVGTGRPLAPMLREVGTRWRRSQIGRRLIERSDAPEAERRREARAAMARLVGRLKGRGDSA